MGRGRAKAKQIKVARKLKYNSGPSTDLSALERELHGASREESYDSPAGEEESDEDDDPYAAYADADDEGEDDYGSWAAGAQR